MKKFCLFLNLLFFATSCVAFWIFLEAYFNIIGQGASAGAVIVSAVFIHIPFIVQLGGAVASMFVAIPAYKLESRFAKVWLTVILLLALAITAITGYLYIGLMI